MNSRLHEFIGRCAVGLLIAVLGLGLWLGYGSWLVDRMMAHAD
jgi:hypothetical protein